MRTGQLRSCHISFTMFRAARYCRSANLSHISLYRSFQVIRVCKEISEIPNVARTNREISIQSRACVFSVLFRATKVSYGIVRLCPVMEHR